MSVFDIIADELAEMSGLYPTERFDRFGADCPEVGEDWSSVADGDGMSLFVGNMVTCDGLTGWFEVTMIGRTCVVEGTTGGMFQSFEMPASMLHQA